MPVPVTPPVVEQEVTLARYPFLPQASSYIAKLASTHRIDFDELLEGGMMEDARKRARGRLVDTIESNEGVQVSAADIHTEEGRVIEAFSFYYARLVVCASEDERLISRWAQAEATRAEKLLKQDERNLEIVARTYFSSIENIQSTQQPITQDYRFGAVGLQQSNTTWRIGLIDFIEVCPKITGPRWRLPNVEIDQGWVHLHQEKTYTSSEKLARLLRERIKQDIETTALSKIQDVTTELAVRLAEPVAMVRQLLSSKATEYLSMSDANQDDWPPCMQKIIQELGMGVNVNHFGRLFLASMAATLALEKQATVEFFRNAPDFSEATTTYQVDHVYANEYTPAGCAKLKVNHNCPVLPGDNRTCDQPWMDHPLKYIRAAQRWRKTTTASEILQAPTSKDKNQDVGQ
jgi:DNA primase large subunit